jgi:hypothetical protein
MQQVSRGTGNWTKTTNATLHEHEHPAFAPSALKFVACLSTQNSFEIYTTVKALIREGRSLPLVPWTASRSGEKSPVPGLKLDIY